MLETLIKRGRGRPPKDGISKEFKSFASNLLTPGVLAGIQYPHYLQGDPEGLPTRYQLERISFTINRVFEKCVGKIEAVSGRPIGNLEIYYLVKQVADFVGVKFKV